MRDIRIGLVVLLLSAAASAQEPLEMHGAWRIVADGENFALRTPAFDAPDTTFSLYCRREQRLFALEIKSPVLAGRQRGQDIRIAFKVERVAAPPATQQETLK